MMKSWSGKGALALAIGCSANAMAATTVVDDYAKTAYPIVLQHGTFGFIKLGPMDYWYGIPADMAEHGAEVFPVQVSPFETSEARGEQLLQRVEEIMAITGAEKVNLIGHSHGAQTVRYVAAVAPDKVASVTTIGGANFGTKAVDAVIDVLEAPLLGTLVDGVMHLVTGAMNNYLEWSTGLELPRNPDGTLWSLSTEGALDFNARFPAGVPVNECDEGEPVVDGVYYYSWSGTKPFNNWRDPSDYIFAITQQLFPTPTDGLVEQCKSHLGDVIRDDYRMNHLDEMNHFFGLVGMSNPSPKALFREHANRLKLQGL